ncbi:RHTO0S26e00166g1_1 [Rhodotorula toruloides]|uniref:RHTO0S26e00166g1_1 n=1 Tax=Rhodotorula toruloides TaxID=5286 RepID=A0A061BQL4_RHOTO|nr:RHTO0S26e00166g1_1 [Rhodotorula toruloides]
MWPHRLSTISGSPRSARTLPSPETTITRTWSADEKVALIRQLLHYLYDVLSTGMVKQVDHKQLTYRSRDMGRHGESSERRRSRSPERSEHSLAHSLLNQPLSARKARIYYGMV